MKNEELISKYRQTQDASYLDTLYKQNEKLLFRLCNSLKCDIDETYIGFMESIRRYDESKGKWSTLCYMCIQHDILCKRRKHTLDTISIDTKTSEDLTIADSIGDEYDFVEELQNKELVKHYMKNLTSEEKEIIKHYYYGDMNMKQIARIMGLTERQVQSRVAKALNKMKGVAYNGK